MRSECGKKKFLQWSHLSINAACHKLAILQTNLRRTRKDLFFKKNSMKPMRHYKELIFFSFHVFFFFLQTLIFLSLPEKLT
jgi:hypothetical protein